MAVKLPGYTVGDKVATRKAYGQALAALGARRDVVAMDGEVSNSTYADEFAHEYPERYFEMYIAEQQSVAAAVGFSVRGYRPFASTFAAFLTRAYDFIRMAAISQANTSAWSARTRASSRSAPMAPAQMALEDLAMMRAVQGSTVLYPSDATSTAALVQAMADRDGVVYMRTTRGAYPVLYAAGEAFPVGGAKVLRASDEDQVTLIGAGVTLDHACLAAADQLKADGLSARVIDVYSVKPIDTDTLTAAAAATAWKAGGRRGSSPRGRPRVRCRRRADRRRVCQPDVRHLAVSELPGSGTSEELLDAARISAQTHRGCPAAWPPSLPGISAPVGARRRPSLLLSRRPCGAPPNG